MTTKIKEIRGSAELTGLEVYKQYLRLVSKNNYNYSQNYDFRNSFYYPKRKAELIDHYRPAAFIIF